MHLPRFHNGKKRENKTNQMGDNRVDNAVLDIRWVWVHEALD